MARTDRIVEQTRRRLAGDMPESAPGWSACTTAMRAIAKGRINNRSSTATRLRWWTTRTGIVVDYTVGDYAVEYGNPADAAQLAPRSRESSNAPAPHPGRPPPTGATARRAWKRRSTISG